MKKSMKKRKFILFLAIPIILIAAVGIGVKIYSRTVRISGSAENDLMEELVAFHGESYTGKPILTETIGQAEFSVLESLEFSMDAEQKRPWNDSMPEQDNKGTLLSKAYWISIYNCRAEYVRYVVADGEKIPGTETYKYISYKAYEDNDLNSRATAFLDASSAQCTYSGSQEEYEDLEALIAKAYDRS